VFSDRGDSGALVYNTGGEVAGMINGGVGSFMMMRGMKEATHPFFEDDPKNPGFEIPVPLGSMYMTPILTIVRDIESRTGYSIELA
jgi:hypothetical protein